MHVKKNRIGERRMMNCGEYATIIAYRSRLDLDVQFDDKSVSLGRNYSNFKAGSIGKPRKSRVGERRLMHCGEYATIIKYVASYNIDVKFDTGEIVKDRAYASFLKGSIRKPKKSELTKEVN